ncbi:MAG TPA: glycine cleavage system aminomethyltransferase GcvT [Opitutaceae bacterium]|jgi:aminomethyltransferase|nr:glycine cleavage system aminomethyltransferase GcvT [Opitutaceae bacterium]
MPDLKKTPLRDFHAANGAKLVDFAGWEMPVQYRSILEEHKAVRRAAGLFDVSHMGEVDIQGPGAMAFLNGLVTNNVSKMYPGRILYTPMCHPDGGVIDDLLIYMRGPEDFFLCINAGNIDVDLEWINARAAGKDLTVTDRSSSFALLAVQGPKAVEIVQTLTETPLAPVKYYHFTEGTVAGIPCIISRTGYTGEDGVELYHPAKDAAALAAAILAAGKEHGIELAGLGARDSLRLEAGFPLHGHEISREISPLTAGLGWTVKFDKEGDFSGREALAAEKKAGSSRKVVFFRTKDRRIVRPETPVLGANGSIVGRVLSGTLSPILSEAIGSALVEAAEASKPLHADVRGTLIELHPVKPPFIELPKKT